MDNFLGSEGPAEQEMDDVGDEKHILSLSAIKLTEEFCIPK